MVLLFVSALAISELKWRSMPTQNVYMIKYLFPFQMIFCDGLMKPFLLDSSLLYQSWMLISQVPYHYQHTTPVLASLHHCQHMCGNQGALQALQKLRRINLLVPTIHSFEPQQTSASNSYLLSPVYGLVFVYLASSCSGPCHSDRNQNVVVAMWT